MPVPILPIELYSEIFIHISDYPTLYTLLFISHALHREVLVQLYSTISTRNTNGWFIHALRTIASNGDIAELVIELSVTQMNMAVPPDLPYLLADAYRRMKNLKILFMMNVLERGCFPGRDAAFQLNSFSVLGRGVLGCVKDFLEGQYEMRELLINGLGEERFIPSSSSLPRLKVLTASLSAIEDIIPGRPITHVSVEWGDNTARREINWPTVRSLRLFYAFSLPLFEREYDTLECLEIHIPFSSSKPLILLSPLFERMSRLRRIRLNATYRSVDEVLNLPWQRLLDTVPSLTLIQVTATASERVSVKVFNISPGDGRNTLMTVRDSKSWGDNAWKE